MIGRMLGEGKQSCTSKQSGRQSSRKRCDGRNYHVQRSTVLLSWACLGVRMFVLLNMEVTPNFEMQTEVQTQQ